MDYVVFLSEQWVLVTVLLVLIALLVFSEQLKAGSSISVHELTRLVNSENAVVLDIRESKEFTEGHIVNAINIPFNKLKDRTAELKKYRESQIVVVDKMGQHASGVGKQLKQDGFNVQRLGGGMSEWQTQNLPVVK